MHDYQLVPGDVIHIDAGTYEVPGNLVLGTALSYVTIEGPSSSDAPAILDRNNSSAGSYVFDFEGAVNTTIENLSITGAYDGIYASPDGGSSHITITGSSIFGNADAGINITSDTGSSGQFATNGYANISGNNIYGQPTGIRFIGPNDTIANNDIHDESRDGIDFGNGSYYSPYDLITGNTLKDIAGTAIANSYGTDTGADRLVISDNIISGASTGISLYPYGLAIDNTISDSSIGIFNRDGEVDNNVLFADGTGIVIDYEVGYATGNRVYDNTIGISAQYGTPVITGNFVYSNQTGISVLQTSGASIKNNLVYANTDTAISIANSGDAQVVNNTVYELVGDDVDVNDSSINTLIENNILWVEAGYDLNVAPDSEQGFSSDFNDLFTMGTGILGQWENQNFTSLLNWTALLNLDVHSITANPGFANVAGPDGVLGYDADTGIDYGQDDDFHELPGSPVVDAGNPSTPSLAEPQPNGGRVNLGAYGGTSQAAVSTTQAAASTARVVQVTSPAGTAKLRAGQITTINFRTAGLSTVTDVAQLDASGTTVGAWTLASIYPTRWRRGCWRQQLRRRLYRRHLDGARPGT